MEVYSPDLSHSLCLSLTLCVHHFYFYVTSSFVSLSILIVMYVPFCVLNLIVLFCELFVCKCVMDYCHRDIGTPFDYPNWSITRKDVARPALSNFFFLLSCVFRSLYSVYCLCVNVYCTAATGCQPNYSYIYIYIYIYINFI
jgi:hypothetical protein